MKHIAGWERGFDRLSKAWLPAPARHDVLALALLACLWLLLAVTGWGAWAHPHVDDGRELQLPVEIASGKALYRDLAYPYGPAAPYLNAAVVMVAGPRIEVFFVLGLLVTLLGAGLVYGVTRLLVWPALALAPAAYWLAAGLRPWFVDTVVPYSHAAVYGSLTILAALWLACRNLKLGQVRASAWIPALAGLAMLFKIEFALPALLIVVVHAAGLGWRQRALAALGPLAAAAVYAGLTLWLGYEFMFQDNFNWTPDSYFFRHFGGAMLRPAVWNSTPEGVVKGAIWWVALWGGSAVVFSRLPERASWIAAAAMGVFLWYRAPMRVLRHGVLNETLFWIVVCVCVAATVRVIRTRQTGLAHIALASAVAALTSMRAAGHAGMGSSFVPYTIPMVMALAALVQAAVQFVSARMGGGFRSAPAGILLVAALFCLIANRTSGREFVWHGGLEAAASERGSLLVPAGEAEPVRKTLDFLAGASQRGERVWIMPEDMTLAYLSGTGFPYRQYQLLPGSPAPGMWTGRLLEQVNSHPAEWVLVCTRRFDEYGVRWFGTSFHQQILEFVERRYEPVREFGDFSLKPERDQWGARLYRLRKAPAAGQPEDTQPEGIK